MLDALKFAFEILIVGALTLPWLMILVHFFSPDSTLSMNSYLSPFPEATQGVLAGILLLAFGYVAGSAVSRISRDLFNDEMFGAIPSEDSIRNSVYYDEYCKHNIIANSKDLPYDNSASSKKQTDLKVIFCAEDPAAQAADPKAVVPTLAGPPPTPPSSAPAASPSPAAQREGWPASPASPAPRCRGSRFPHRTRPAPAPPPQSARTADIAPAAAVPAETAEGHQDKKSQAIREMFSLQEGELLLLGQDKVDRLKQYYDQITVLRGAAANALMLFMVCIFGSCANAKVRLEGPSKLAAYLPSIAVLALGNYSLLTHVRIPTYHLADLYIDPPLAESVVILVGMLGFLMVLKAEKKVAYPKAGILAAVLFIICFEGWWWTEVMYDLHIIHSQTELHSHLGEAQAPGANGAGVFLSRRAACHPAGTAQRRLTISSTASHTLEFSCRHNFTPLNFALLPDPLKQPAPFKLSPYKCDAAGS